MATTPDREPVGRVTKLGLYIRLAFGALVVFGVVGSLSGYKSGSTLVFILTSLCWVLSKILVEAIYAYQALTGPRPPKNDPPIDPPTATA